MLASKTEMEKYGLFSLHEKSSLPQFTCDRFLELFFAVLVTQGIWHIPCKDVTRAIYDVFSENPAQYSDLFENVGFRVGLTTILSPSIDDSLIELQNTGMIGRMNPAYEKMVIFMRDDIASNVIDRYSEKKEMMEDLVERMKLSEWFANP